MLFGQAMSDDLLFRQLFDRETCTYTYLLGDPETGEAVLIDPVRELVDRDVQLLSELDLFLRYTLETHVHADHVTASGTLRNKLGSRSVLSKTGGADCADVQVSDGDTIQFGRHTVEVITTPGHTNSCVSYYLREQGMLFTGDALFIRGCGRTDFQQGDANTLYRSIHDKVFTLPDDTAIYPGHDYKGRTRTTVSEEKRFNPRLGGGKTQAEFVEIMDNLNLSLPARLDVAVPANLSCGLAPSSDEQVRGWAPIVRDGKGIPEITVAWVSAHADECHLVDVREETEYTGDLGHVPGSQLVPIARILQHADGWDRTDPVVLICRSGGRSGDAAQRLEALGFAKVASMAGGMLQWNASSLPIAR